MSVVFIDKISSHSSRSSRCESVARDFLLLKTRNPQKLYRRLTLAKKIAGLTNRQREFARYYVEGRYSSSECARLAGYSNGAAKQYSHKLLDGISYPLVSEQIKELREERERKYSVTLLGQLKRLDQLSRGA